MCAFNLRFILVSSSASLHAQSFEALLSFFIPSSFPPLRLSSLLLFSRETLFPLRHSFLPIHLFLPSRFSIPSLSSWRILHFTHIHIHTHTPLSLSLYPLGFPSLFLRVRAASTPSSPRFSRSVLRSHYLRLSLRALIWPAGVQLPAPRSQLQFFHALHSTTRRRRRKDPHQAPRRSSPPPLFFRFFLRVAATSPFLSPPRDVSLLRTTFTPCLFPRERLIPREAESIRRAI